MYYSSVNNKEFQRIEKKKKKKLSSFLIDYTMNRLKTPNQLNSDSVCIIYPLILIINHYSYFFLLF